MGNFLGLKKEHYDIDTKPTPEWIQENCFYDGELYGFRYKDYSFKDILFQGRNKCTMLNEKWRDLGDLEIKRLAK